MPPREIDDVYEYALELATDHVATATAIGVAATVTADGPIALAGACQIFDECGLPFTAARILDAATPSDRDVEDVAASYARVKPERRVNVPGVGEPPNLRYLLALAGIRAVAVIRHELAIELDRRGERGLE